MQETKFRLIQNNKIVGYERHVLIDGYISIMHAISEDSIWRFIYPDYKYWISHDVKEQFTGLCSKNDKRELYPGDRVVIGSDRGVLVWDDMDLCWAIELDDGEYQSICRYYTYEEIEKTEYIGNIHD